MLVAQFHKIINQDNTNLKILRAAFLVALGTLSVKFLSMAKDVITAAIFGTSIAMDCYLLALAVPSYIINVVAGSLNAALIPTYTEVRLKEGDSSADQLLSSVVTINALFLCTLGVLVYFAAPHLFNLVAAKFLPEERRLCEQLLWIMLPSIVLSGSTVILSSVANTKNRFFGVSLVAAVVPALIIVAVLLLHKSMGIYALALGTILGFLAELYLILGLIRRLKLKLRITFFKVDEKLKRVLWQYLPVLSGSSLVCSSQVVDQAMSALLGGGSVASLNYGIKLSAFLSSVGTMALGTALLPHFSIMTANRDWKAIRSTIITYTLLIFAITIPLVTAMIWFSEPIVRICFERGAFTPEDTKLVARIQSIAVLQLPFISMSVLFVRLVSSLKMNQILLCTNLIGVTLNITLDYVLMQYWGILGIALSTVIVFIVSSHILGAIIFFKLRKEESLQAQAELQ